MVMVAVSLSASSVSAERSCFIPSMKTSKLEASVVMLAMFSFVDAAVNCLNLLAWEEVTEMGAFNVDEELLDLV
jgi:hypothetical protein